MNSITNKRKSARVIMGKNMKHEQKDANAIKVPYIWIPFYIIGNDNLNVNDKFLVSVILNYERCKLSNKQLAELINTGTENIRKILKKLKDLGILISKQTKKGRVLSIKKSALKTVENDNNGFTGVAMPTFIIQSDVLTPFEKLLLSDIMSVELYYFSNKQIAERYNKDERHIIRSINKLINLHLIENLGIKYGRRNLRAETFETLYKKLYGDILQTKSYVSADKGQKTILDKVGVGKYVTPGVGKYVTPPGKICHPIIEYNRINNIEVLASQFSRSASLRAQTAREPLASQSVALSFDSVRGNASDSLSNSSYGGNLTDKGKKDTSSPLLSKTDTNTPLSDNLNTLSVKSELSDTLIEELPYDLDEQTDIVVPRSAGNKSYEKLLLWSEKRRKNVLGLKRYKFINRIKQYNAMKKAKQAGYSPKDLQERWLELEQDPYWLEKGFDWHSVVSTLDEKPL